MIDAPFPYFGGKRKAAAEVWRRFGAIDNFVEPFCGSCAVLLQRPDPAGTETINDLNGYVANFWRAIQADPEAVAHHADWPVNENDLHARHAWLVAQKDRLRPQLEGDPEWHDPKIAGWWVWGMACWIGSGFCSGNGPWVVDEHRKLVHLGNHGQGVNRKLVHLGDHGQGEPAARLVPWFSALSERLKRVRVCSGEWSRVCGPSVTVKHGLTGVFLDPPYADTAGRDPDLYTEDSLTVAHDVRRWAIEQSESPLMRIALCGYEGEHDMPASWSVYAWNAGSGFAGQGERTDTGRRERCWFSPHCLSAQQPSLFAQEEAPCS